MKKQLFLLVIMLLPMTALAQDIAVDGIHTIDGINYNLSGSSATLVSGNYKFAGLTIPSAVTYKNKSFTVTAIGDKALMDCTSLKFINIPNTVTVIGNNAFYNCTSLTSVTMGTSVKSIGNSAFYYCTSLTSIEIPNSVTSIGNSAFRGCSGQTSIDIPNSVTNIGESAFEDCTGLTSIDIPNSVTNIGESAFRGCTGLTSIDIPNSVTNIGESAFSSCSRLTSIVVADDNGAYDSRNACNAIIETATNTLISGCQNTVIPSGVTSIGNHAFSGSTGLTSIEIPNSVTSIGNHAFYYCTGLTSIEISNRVTSIGNYAFCACFGLTSIEIPNSLATIGNYAFNYCTHLTSIDIPNSVTSIGESSFSSCTGLTSVTIGNGVTGIGKSAFSGCKALTSVTIESNAFVSATHSSSTSSSAIFGTQVTNYIIGDQVTAIGDFTFYGCSDMTSVAIPNSVTNIGICAFGYCSNLVSVTLGNNVTSIGISAFSYCSKLVSVTMGDNVRSIGASAFRDCSNLTSVRISNGLTILGNYAFSGSTGLTSIEIPDGVTSIGNYAFSSCTGLTSVTIGNGVTSIGESAFESCNKLVSVTMGNGVTSIGKSAFESCSSLTSITLPKGVTNIGESAFQTCSSLASVNIPDGVTSIEKNTFRACYDLNSIIIPNSVTSIGNYAFRTSGLTSIIIPNGVTSIGSCAFELCGEMKSITIGSGVTSIGAYAVSGIAGLKNVYCLAENVPTSTTDIFYNTATSATLHVPAGSMDAYKTTSPWSNFRTVKVLTYYIDGIYYDLSGTKATVVAGDIKYSGKVVIPSTVNYNGKTYEVTAIAASAFKDCTSLTAATIPNSVTSIGEDTFKGCTALRTVTINNDALVSESRSYKNPLSTIFGSQVTTYIIGSEVSCIGNSAFYECSSITSIVIPNSVTTINNAAFAYCTGLTSIEIPINTTKIANNAFNCCSGLTSIVVAGGNTVYDSRDGCNAIIETATNTLLQGCKNTVIPDNITSIGTNAFTNCTGLTSIVIPSSVTTIGEISFRFCTRLSDVYCYAESVPNADPTCFNLSNIANATLHVPAGSMEAYKTTKPWSDFYKIERIKMPEYTITYYVDGEEYKSYKIEKGASIVPEAEPTKEGYTFSGWSEIPKTMPAHDITVTGTFTINKYKLTYTVDGEVYKSFDVEYGASITPEAEPTKEYYTFSGWSEIPKTMPAHDVTVSGTFAINKYKLTYNVDGELYKSYDVEYGLSITPEAEPIKEGYTFSGWSEIPETMPAHDVTVTGMFSVNKYKLIYIVDGELYKSFDVEYGTSITPEAVPTKEYYTFSGWSEIPRTMPANDVIVTGKFSINKYKLIYIVDGEFYKSFDVEYDVSITPEVEPTKEGYTFSGWSEIPETMPAHDVIVTGMFSVNSYKLTFMIDDKVYKETMYEYGATITPEPQPEGDYQTFEWIDLPQTMPAYDVVVYASYTSGIIEVLMASQHNVRIYSPNGKKLNKQQKGLNIIILDDGTVKKIIMK